MTRHVHQTLLLSSLFLAACGGSSSAPTTPTPAAPKPAMLQITLSPDLRAYGGCATPSTTFPYSWGGVTTQIKETGGGAFTVTGYHGLFFDVNTGATLNTVDYAVSTFPTYMSGCGAGSLTIPANATMCSVVSSCFSSNSRTLKYQLTVDGRDETGATATFKSQVITLLPPS